MKVYLHSFGCRVNQYEGERVRAGFLAGGGTQVEDFKEADVSVLNTCSVTDEADKEIRALIRRIYRENPEGKVIVTGCYANRAPAELQNLFPEALIVANEEKDSIPALAGCSLGLSETTSGRSINTFFGRTRAMIKVQDGCDMYCSYCIIPTTRPNVSCRAPEEILAEAQALLDNGYREIVLCGIRLGRYWAADKNGKWMDFLALIQFIAALEGDFRIRLSSIEITDMTDRFLEGYSQISKTVPYFHIPIQSGSDAVLKAMKRWYRRDFYAQRIEAVRKALGPDMALFTDFMVGFPTETQEQFEDSLSFAKQMNYAGMHIFKYSSREETPAAIMPASYSTEELDGRMLRTREADKNFREGFAQRFIGKTLPVLVESNRGGQGRARAENFLEVNLSGPAATGEWTHARIQETKGPRLVGTLDPGN